MHYSIRNRLLVLILLLTAISWCSIAIINYFDTRAEIEELFDAHLVQSAKVLLSLVDMELYEEEHEPEDEIHHGLKDVEEHLYRHKYEKLLAFQIIVKKNSFHFSSASAPRQPLSNNREGFSETTIDGVLWRVFSLHDPLNIIQIHVAEPHSVRSDLIDEIAFTLLIPLLIGLPIISILIWKCVGYTLQPLNEIARNIQKRHTDQLEPVSGFDVPEEIQPLIGSLNRLFARLDKVLQNERRFTSDAAHELRTPLAGLKTQAQTALLTQDPQKREHALRNILISVDRTVHLVEQLLTLARLEPGFERDHFQTCNLTQLIQDTLADVMPLAIEKNITVEFNHKDAIYLLAHPQALSMLVRNLLDNAIRYAPEGGTVDVFLFEDSSGTVFRVCDNGPGISPELREDVFKRFVRANQNHETGSGLGLSIVQRIAELHHAAIHLGESPERGLQVDVCFMHEW